MKQSRKYLLALGSLLIIVSTLGLGIQHLIKPPALTSNLQYMIVDWAEGYMSIEAMAQAPEVDVIARGVIKDVEYDGFNYNTESKFLFKPHWTLKGLSTARPLWIHQTGGVTPLGETYVPFNNPLIQVGDVLVLFLHQCKWAPNEYYVVGGPQGRFVVQGGQVYSIGEVYESPNELVQRQVSMMTMQFHTGGIRETDFYIQLHAILSEH